MGTQPLDWFTLPSSHEWLNFVAVLIGLLAFIGVGEGVRIFFRWPPEVTRKLVHVVVGVLIFFTPQLFAVPLPALLLGLTFVVVNLLAIRFGLFKAIHGTSRQTYGTVYYPLSFLILVLLFWHRAPEIISLSMLVLAFGDAAAAIVGETIKSPDTFQLTSDKKSLEGSWTMFAVSCVTLVMGIAHFRAGMSLLVVVAAAGAAAATATAWEALSSRGFDNLTIPLSTAFVLAYFLLPTANQDLQQYTIGIGLAIGIAVVSFYARFLSASGSVATFILASLIFGVGGWKWTVPILLFFLLSSLLSKVGRTRKKEFEDLFAKSGTRDHQQVAANGGIAGVLIIASFFFPAHDWYPLYLASIAAVTADTWGTEIGLLGKGKTISIISWNDVPKGTSGGVSVVGMLSGAVGAALIALSGIFWHISVQMAMLILVAGLLGSVVDSIVGEKFQARYRCVVCGKYTERLQHCDHPTELVGGIRWISNDAVNIIAAMSGAVLLWQFV